MRDGAVGAFMHARSSLLKHNIATPTRFHGLCPEQDKEMRRCVWYIETVEPHIAASWHCARSFNALHDSACAGGEKRPKKHYARDQSGTLLHMQHAKGYNTLWSKRSSAAAIAHVCACSILFNQYRNSHWKWFEVSAKKSQNMQKCRSQTLEQGIFHVYLHETRL